MTLLVEFTYCISDISSIFFMLTRSIQDFISNSKINRNWSQTSIEINRNFRKLSTFIFDIETMSFREIISDWEKRFFNIKKHFLEILTKCFFKHNIFLNICFECFF